MASAFQQAYIEYFASTNIETCFTSQSLIHIQSHMSLFLILHVWVTKPSKYSTQIHFIYHLSRKHHYATPVPASLDQVSETISSIPPRRTTPEATCGNVRSQSAVVCENLDEAGNELTAVFFPALKVEALRNSLFVYGTRGHPVAHCMKNRNRSITSPFGGESRHGKYC
jgi:hypothetical protein